MSEFFEAIKKGLEEAIEIQNGNIEMIKKENMEYDTFVAKDIHSED